MAIDSNFLLVITSPALGEGEADLGAKLTDLLFKVFADSETLPHKIIFLNAGIFLTTEGSPVEEDLKAIEERGVTLSSCITCLTYFDRMEKVVVGKRSDMKDTVKSLAQYKKVITF
jgi:hypothetical protein